MDYNQESVALPNMNDNGHLVRYRINSILSRAVEKSLVIVCAGMGYGKTRAVFDFACRSGFSSAWIQLSEFNNVESKFWENYTKAIEKMDKMSGEELRELGFPNTEEKMNRYLDIRQNYQTDRQHLRNLIVLDDFHLIKNRSVINFIEQSLNNMPPEFSYILISRELPSINILSLEAQNLVFHIYEEDLNFTENELAQYLHAQRLTAEAQSLHEIYEDTKGWAFSVNLVSRSLKKSRGYWGYARSAMKQNIFKLIETEVWNSASEQLQRFWVSISLIEHHSADLIALLSKDKNLLSEFRQQNAYARFDSYTNTFHIHHLFVDFLRAKQNMLTYDEVRETNKTAGNWCKQNGLIIDAMKYYRKIGDYESIISIFAELPTIVPHNIAVYSIEVFNSAPPDTFTKISLFANRHLRIIASLGNMRDFVVKAEYYECELQKLPEDSDFRNQALGGVYFIWGIVQYLISTIKDQYDYSLFAMMNNCLTKSPLEPNQITNFSAAPWIIVVSSQRQGSPQEAINALAMVEKYVSGCLYGILAGASDIARGELMFYQSNVKAAETHILLGMKRAKEFNQFDLVNKALFYIMRIAVFQGNRAKAEQALKRIEAQIVEKEYFRRFFAYDIAFGWYNYLLRQPEMVPAWQKEDFTPYGHPLFAENLGNHMKARYHYLAKNYLPLLTFIENLKGQELALYGKTEMLALEACARYQIKDKAGAFNALKEAYEMASPNNILMPFVELGKDMRALTAAALRASSCEIPLVWLKSVNQKSNSYAQHQAIIISNYKKHNDIIDEVALSSREQDILRDLYYGFSKSEIAAKHDLSINTVKMISRSIYEKLGANNIAGIVRIVAERKLVHMNN